MNLKNNQAGFIFSLDATLAVLVSLLVLAGVASVGTSSTTYEQHGYLRLERYANDALKVLDLDGTMDNVIQLVEQLQLVNAKQILREDLLKILPEGIQFKVSIADLENVFPDDEHDWESIFENAKEVAVSTHISPMSPLENFKVLAWVPGADESEFVDQIKEPWWTVKKITSGDQSEFRTEILKKEGGRYIYQTIFIPDADIDFANETIENLLTFSENGRILVGGDTLWNKPRNENLNDILGISNITGRITLSDPNLENMYIQRPDHHVIGGTPFYKNYCVDYAGDNVYDYNEDEGTILSKWGTGPESGELYYPGIIYRNENTETPGTGVFFNMNFVQSTIEENVGASDWKKLAKRAIYWKGPLLEFKPINLYVWREVV